MRKVTRQSKAEVWRLNIQPKARTEYCLPVCLNLPVSNLSQTTSPLHSSLYIHTRVSHFAITPLEVNTDSWTASQTPSTLWSRTKGVSVLARQQVRGYEEAVTPPAAERKS